jgi:hypothetical protein
MIQTALSTPNSSSRFVKGVLIARVVVSSSETSGTPSSYSHHDFTPLAPTRGPADFKPQPETNRNRCRKAFHHGPPAEAGSPKGKEQNEMRKRKNFWPLSSARSLPPFEAIDRIEAGVSLSLPPPSTTITACSSPAPPPSPPPQNPVAI